MGPFLQINTDCLAAVKRTGRIRVDLDSNEFARRKKQKRSSTTGKQEPIRIKLELTLGCAVGILKDCAFHGGAEVGHAQVEYARIRGE